jgi:hypothetical protein
MNLVKAQEYAQSLPLAELKKYADGFNPSMIPPWLATGEMQAKMKRAEMANTLQGAANGPQPSVKEQVEQKAGILALQQAQQQAQAQQMMQPRMGAGPVPEGTPQPRPQPQRAGLNQLPSNIEMAGGGIVAFSKAGKVEGKDEEEDNSSQFVKDLASLPDEFDAMKQRAREEDAIKAAQDRRMEKYKQDKLAAQQKTSLFNYLFGSPAREKEGLSKLAELSNAPLAATAAPAAPLDAESQKLVNLAATRSGTGVNTNPALKPSVPPAAGKTDITNLLANQRPPKPAAPAAPAAPDAPTAPAPNSMEAMFRDALANAPKERTVDEIMAEQKAIRAGAGLGEPAGKAQLERIAALQQQYEASKPSGLDELIRVFGQAGASKGLSGTGPAYTAMQAQKRANDLAMAQKINDMMSGVETTQRGEAKDLAGKVGEGREKTLDRGSQFNREKLQTLGTARGQDIQAGSSKYNADMHYKAAMAQMANANVRQDAQEKRLLLDSFKTRLASIDKELAPLLKTPYGPAKAQIAELQAEKAGITKALDEASGISKMMPAPGAKSPGGTTRMRFDAQGNLVK